jgi:hypothetical protein
MPIYWQPVKCTNEDTPALNTTNTINLPKAGALGSVLLLVSCDQNNVARTANKWRLIDFIDKLEVKGNGTTTICSIDARCARALAFHDQGVFTPDVPREYAGNTQFARILINFGERLYDRNKGLNAQNWDSLQLKVLNSLSSTDWNSTKLSYQTYAIMKRLDGGFAGGHFRKEEYRKFTSVAATWTYIDLPTDAKLRRLMLQLETSTTNGVDDTNPTNYATEIKYTIRDREVELFDLAATDAQILELLGNGRDVISHVTQEYHSANYGLRTGVGYPLGWAAAVVNKDGAVGSVIPSHGDETNSCLKPSGYEADHPWSYLIKGMGPESTILFRHDRHPDLSDMLDLAAADVKPANFDIYSKNASGVVRVVLDRLFTKEGKGA